MPLACELSFRISAPNPPDAAVELATALLAPLGLPARLNKEHKTFRNEENKFHSGLVQQSV